MYFSFGYLTGIKWYLDINTDGKMLLRNRRFITSGMVSIENDMFCLQSIDMFKGHKFCGPIFRNPEG